MLTLMMGTAMAQAIPLAASPILTRLYTPADFGMLSLFMAVTSIFGVIACGRYELAIQLADDEKEAVNVAALSLLIALVLSSVLLLVALLFRISLARMLGNEAIAPWLFAIPLAVLLSGVTTVLSYLNSRGKCFSDIATSNVVKSTVLVTLQAGFGSIKAGGGGLITGQVASMLAANVRLYRNATQGRPLRNTVTWQRMCEGAKKYINQPKYTLWASLANSLSLNVASIMISNLYMGAALGHYALVQRVLSAPAALIGGSIGQVFFQRASEAKRTTGSARHVFLKTSFGLLIIAVPAYILLYFVVDRLFAFVFGEAWRVAGRYAQIMVPLFAVRFIISPLSVVNQVNRQNLGGMVSQLLFLGASVAVMIGCAWAGFSMEQMLKVFTGVMVVLYGGYYVYIYRTTG